MDSGAPEVNHFEAVPLLPPFKTYRRKERVYVWALDVGPYDHQLLEYTIPPFDINEKVLTYKERVKQKYDDRTFKIKMRSRYMQK